MSKKREYTHIRTGKFLWRDEHERQQYVARIREKIDYGYYRKTEVTDYVVNTLAPVISDALSI